MSWSDGQMCSYVKHQLRLEGEACAEHAWCVQSENVGAVDDTYATCSGVSSECSSFPLGVLAFSIPLEVNLVLDSVRDEICLILVLVASQCILRRY